MASPAAAVKSVAESARRPAGLGHDAALRDPEAPVPAQWRGYCDEIETAAGIRPPHGGRGAATFGEASTAAEARDAAERALAAMTQRRQPQ